MKQPVIFLMLLFATSTAFADDLVSVRTHHLPDSTMQQIQITSRSDNITIREVTVNKGVCKPQEGNIRSFKMKFGQVVNYGNFICEPIEISITTDLDTETFHLNDGNEIQGGLSAAIQSQYGYMFGQVQELPFRIIKITNHDDKNTIRYFEVNRRNCNIIYKGDQTTLLYGQTYIIKTSCVPIEIKIWTDQGAFTFNWDKQ